jgi:hypothetical protein
MIKFYSILNHLFFFFFLNLFLGLFKYGSIFFRADLNLFLRLAT